MIDTHCHLEMLQFKDDLQEVLNRAKEAGIEALVTIGSDFKGCKGAVELSMPRIYRRKSLDRSGHGFQKAEHIGQPARAGTSPESLPLEK